MIKNKIVAFNYFGGKYTWLEELYKHSPEHLYFTELFCGSAAYSLNKIPSKLDTINDLDGNVYTFFKMLRNHPEALMQALHLSPVSREEYDNAFPISGEGITEMEAARRFFVRCRMSFQGSGISKSTGFNSCIKTTERGVSKNVSKYLSAVEKLPQVVERLKSIQLEKKDYREMLERCTGPEHFIYVDPPYELRSRKYKKWYNHEFKDEDHVELAERLKASTAKIMISHSKTDFYEQLYKDWNFVELPARGHSMKNGKKTSECIWMNY